jgi:hypothetical protein
MKRDIQMARAEAAGMSNDALLLAYERATSELAKLNFRDMFTTDAAFNFGLYRGEILHRLGGTSHRAGTRTRVQ